MRSLFVFFLALSLLLGPLQGVWGGTPSSDGDELTPADKTALATNGATLKRVFLESLMDRTRLFEVINSSLASVQDQCLIRQAPDVRIDPAGQWSTITKSNVVTVNPKGNCPLIVQLMLNRISANYPDLRKLYVVYNLLRNTRTLMSSFLQAEKISLAWSPNDYAPGDLSFNNPIEGLLHSQFTDIMVLTPVLEDYRAAADQMTSINQTEICSTGLCPSRYDASFTGFIQKACSDYIGRHMNDNHTWPSHPETICSQFHLTFDEKAGKFMFAVPASGGEHLLPEQRALLYEVISGGILKSLKAMITNARQTLMRIIEQAPQVILMRSETPTLDELKNATEKIAKEAQITRAKFDEIYFKLQNDPSDLGGRMALLARGPVVQNLVDYNSSAMTQEASPAAFSVVRAELMHEYALRQLGSSVISTAGYIILGGAATVACGIGTTLVEKFPAPACVAFLTLAMGGWMAIESVQDFNAVFGELFANTQSGTIEENALRKDPSLSLIDPIVKDPSFDLKMRSLRDLESLDSAHASALLAPVFMFGGVGLTKLAKAGLSRALLGKYELSVAEKAQIAPDAAKVFLELDPLHLRAIAR